MDEDALDHIALALTDILRKERIKIYMPLLCTEPDGTAHYWILDEAGYGRCCQCQELCKRVEPLVRKPHKPVEAMPDGNSSNIVERKAWGVMMRQRREAKALEK